MPPARKSPTTKTARAAKTVSARASATRAATRREVEQSIARFEKRLDEAHTALQTLGGHLGRGATSSYKDVTASLRALRRDAVKTNKQALKDFDKLRTALTKSGSSASTGTSSGAKRTASRSTTARTGARATAARSSGTRAASTRSTASRSGASRSTASRSTTSRSTTSRSRSSARKKS
jgi:hypothetical protein